VKTSFHIRRNLRSVALAIGATLLAAAWAHSIRASAQDAPSDRRAFFCIYNYITKDKNNFFTLAVPRTFVSSRTSGEGHCAKVFGLNLMFSYPAMTRVTSEQLSCRGDCGGLMRLMIENQNGSKASLSERAYHITLLNDGTLTPKFARGDVVEKLEQENNSEVYIQKNQHGDEKRWMIQKTDKDEVLSAIECSISTPGKLCVAYFHLTLRPEVSLQLSFLMERLADWSNIRGKTEQFVGAMLN
jgi:hypothetical protein